MKLKLNRKTLICSGIALALTASMSLAYTLGRSSAEQATLHALSATGTTSPAEDEQLQEANRMLLATTTDNVVYVRHETAMPSIRRILVPGVTCHPTS
jgi:hypothetical protein